MLDAGTTRRFTWRGSGFPGSSDGRLIVEGTAAREERHVHGDPLGAVADALKEPDSRRRKRSAIGSSTAAPTTARGC